MAFLRNLIKNRIRSKYGAFLYSGNLRLHQANYYCSFKKSADYCKSKSITGKETCLTTKDTCIFTKNSCIKTGEKYRSRVNSLAGQRLIDPLDITFEDTKTAFKSKTTWELIRAYIVYTTCSFNFIVDNNKKLMKVAQTILGTRLFGLLMKATFYGHFVAGEDQYKIKPVLQRLRDFGVKPILDYSVEEDISKEEAEKLEVEASVSKAGEEKVQGARKQYHVDKKFADRRYKVHSARTYFYLNEATCERNMEIFVKCIEAVADLNDDTLRRFPGYIPCQTFGTGITAIKLTALGRPQLLLQLSEVIYRTRQYMSELDGCSGNVLKHHMQPQDLEKKLGEAQILDQAPVKKFLTKLTSDEEGILHLFPWSGILDENFQLSESFKIPDLKAGKMVSLISQLTSKEEEMFRNMVRRLNTVCSAAKQLDIRIMIDAEQSYFQPAITRITLEMMRKYNKDKAIVFNTYQTYLKAAYDEVITDLEQANRQNFFFGAKLVRGAYIDQERARAAAMGYPDPTNPNFEATTEMYHKTLLQCLKQIKQLKCEEAEKRIGIMVATHNEDTIRFTIEKMKEIGISPDDKVICFGQLYGMCDYITFPLSQAGYSSYKYIPYGPVNEVLPYISRRAMENRGVLNKIKKEKRLILSALFDRIRTFNWFYTPKGNYMPV